MDSVLDGLYAIIHQLQEAAASGVVMKPELKNLLDEPQNRLVDKILGACLPDIWVNPSNLPSAHDSTDWGVYLHLFQTRGISSKPWAYIGSATSAQGGLRRRVAQHKNPAYRASNPSHHYKKYDQFANDHAISQDDFFRVTNDSVARDSTTVLFLEVCLIAYFGVVPGSSFTAVETPWHGLNRSNALRDGCDNGQAYSIWRANQPSEVVAAQYERAHAGARRWNAVRDQRAFESLTTVGLVVKLNRMGRPSTPQPRSFRMLGFTVNIGKQFVEDLHDDTSKSLEARVILRGEGLDVSYRSWSCRLEKQNLKPAVVQRLFGRDA